MLEHFKRRLIFIINIIIYSIRTKTKGLHCFDNYRFSDTKISTFYRNKNKNHVTNHET